MQDMPIVSKEQSFLIKILEVAMRNDLAPAEYDVEKLHDPPTYSRKGKKATGTSHGRQKHLTRKGKKATTGTSHGRQKHLTRRGKFVQF